MSALARVLVLTALALGVAPREHVVIGGTQVSLAAPQGFTESERFCGFESPKTGASVMVIEMGVAYAELESTISEEALRRGGIKLLESTDVDVAGRHGHLLHTSQNAAGMTFLKWTTMFGDESRSVQVMATYPEAEDEHVGQALRECVLGAKWDRTIVVDPFAHLPFTIEVPSELKFYSRMQNGLTFTRTGEAKKDAPADPAYVITPSISPAKITDLEKFAKSRLKQTPLLRELEIESTTEIDVGGLKACELVAHGKDEKLDLAIVRYFVVVLDGEGYYIASGDVGAELRDTYLSVFRKATASFKLRPRAESSDKK